MNPAQVADHDSNAADGTHPEAMEESPPRKGMNHARTASPGTNPQTGYNGMEANALELSLREHQIAFFLPPGAVMTNARLELPYGALISGTLVGDLICEGGSVVITKEGRVSGNIEANRIYIEGDLLSTKEKRCMATGHSLIVASSNARINADLRSRAFALHQPKLWGRLITIEDGPGKIE